MLWPPRLPLRVLRCPPRGLIHLGAARRWIALPPRLPLSVLRCPSQDLHRVPNKLGRPGWWGVWCSGIKEEAVGRGTAAAPNATPVWSATRPRCTVSATNLADQAGGVVAPTLAAARAALPPEGANPPWGGPAVDSFAPMLAAARAALPPARPAPYPKQTWQTRLVGLLPPSLPLRVLRCPPEGANPALGRPGGGLIWLGRVGRV